MQASALITAFSSHSRGIAPMPGTKEHYLGGIADGSISYCRFGAVSDIEVMADGNVAIVR